MNADKKQEKGTASGMMQEILEDLHQVLENEDLLWNVGEETHPEKYDFSGMSSLLRQAYERESSHANRPGDPDSAGLSPGQGGAASAMGRRTGAETENDRSPFRGGQTPGESGGSRAARSVTPSRAGQPFLELPANQKCTLCNDRVYATRRFLIRGSRPVVVVHFEGPFGKNIEARDKSNKLYFSSEQEDDLFRRMVERLGLRMEELHFQQLPACHFVAETSTPEDWNERTTNCLTHLEDTIQREGIKLALITGPAAVLLFGEDGARKFSESGEVIQMPVLSAHVAAVVVRSPAALLSLESRTKKAASTGEEAQKEAREQEIKVKKQILASLEKAFSLPGIR